MVMPNWYYTNIKSDFPHEIVVFLALPGVSDLIFAFCRLAPDV